MFEYINNIRIVLVETTHPGNIGAVARAMKTMCHKNLYLVKPSFFPSAEATARATGADDILAEAVICNTIEEAINDCHMVIGTSARNRSIPWPVISPRECAEKTLQAAGSGQVAILFGRESSGLSNEEIESCHLMLKVPTHENYSSLNIAAAVQIICYENLQKILSDEKSGMEIRQDVPMATNEEMQMFYQHLEQCLIELGYYDPLKPRLLMRRLKRLFNRALLDQNEMNILRGILSAIQEKQKDN